LVESSSSHDKFDISSGSFTTVSSNVSLVNQSNINKSFEIQNLINVGWVPILLIQERPIAKFAMMQYHSETL